jgi:2-polyprenyl-6-methoxyphenol hydroxylase-like FAD-dependent oxidoreductase
MRRCIPAFGKIRPADLYVMKNHVQPGIVLIGDAFATSCPAAGTGTNKVFTDVDRLCNVHIPRWLTSEGVGEEKIAAFFTTIRSRRPPMRTPFTRHFSSARFRLTPAFHGLHDGG